MDNKILKVFVLVIAGSLCISSVRAVDSELMQELSRCFNGCGVSKREVRDLLRGIEQKLDSFEVKSFRTQGAVEKAVAMGLPSGYKVSMDRVDRLFGRGVPSCEGVQRFVVNNITGCWRNVKRQIKKKSKGKGRRNLKADCKQWKKWHR